MSAEKKKELQVAALENGTAIDHIPPSQLFKVAKLLGLENMDNTITIGNNFHSNKMGSKGMIKISDKFFCDEEINRIALIAPNVILNIIRDYEVVEKKTVTLPDELVGLVKCNRSASTDDTAHNGSDTGNAFDNARKYSTSGLACHRTTQNGFGCRFGKRNIEDMPQADNHGNLSGSNGNGVSHRNRDNTCSGGSCCGRVNDSGALALQVIRHCNFGFSHFFLL